MINTYPAITLDGVDDTYSFPISFNDTDYVIILVYSYIGSQTIDKRLINGSNNWFLGPLNGSRHGFYNGSYNFGKGVDSAQFVVHTAFSKQDTARNIINDSLYGFHVGGFSPGNSVVFSSNAVNAQLAELLYYEGQVEDSMVDVLNQYLMDRYAPPVNLGNDRVVCSFPDSIGVDMDYALDFQWSTGDTTPSTIINSAGTYYLTITDQFERISVDSVNFIQDTDDYQVNFGFEDSTICQGDELSLDLYYEQYQYNWSTGDTTPAVNLNIAGMYTVTVTNCLNNTSIDTINLITNEPRFSLGPDSTTCHNIQITLFADSNFSSVTYSWSTGDVSPTIVVDSGATYQLTVTDNFNCTFSDQIAVTVDSSLYDLSLGPDTLLCEGNFISLYGDQQFITSYLWGSGNTNPAERVDTAGTYSLFVTSTRCEYRDTVIVGIKGLAPTADFNSQNFCFLDSVLFTNTSFAPTGDTLTNYLWDFGGLDSISTENSQYQFPDTGLYRVKLKVTTDKQCEDTTSTLIDINPLPTVDFDLNGSCSKRPVQFISQSIVPEGSIQVYLWDFGDGRFSSLQNPHHIYDSLGSYDVKLETTTNFGCLDSATLTFNINPSPVVSYVSGNQCFGDTTELLSTSTIAAGEIVEYTWFTNNQQISDSIASILYLNPGKEQIVLLARSDSSCLSLLRDSIDIFESPIANFIAPDVCAGESIVVQDSSTSGNDTISSYFYELVGNGINEISNDQNPIFQIDDVGSYTLKQIVETQNLCVDSTSQIVQSNQRPTADYRFINNGSGSPYTLEVENNSSGAQSYLWSSGDGRFSTDEEAEFVYTEVGEYDVQLISSSSDNCSDTTVNTLRVLPYFLDAALQDARLIKDLDGSSKFRIQLANNGNNKIEEVIVEINPENGFGVAEKIEQDINKGNSIFYTLNSFLPNNGDQASFICMTITSVNNVADDVAENNKICFTAFPDRIFLNAYPNPIDDRLIMDFVLLSAGKLTIVLYDAQGREVARPLDDQFFEEGYHQETLNAEAFRSGTYILRFDFEGFTDEMKLIKR